jgi:hypothetical protein
VAAVCRIARSALDDTRLRLMCSRKKEAMKEERTLKRMLRKYSASTQKWLHIACVLCGGFDGDSEIFLVSAEVLHALENYFNNPGVKELDALQAAVNDALKARPPRGPPTNKLLLLKAVIDAAWWRVIELSTPANSTFTMKRICMTLALARLSNNEDPRLQQELIDELQLKQGADGDSLTVVSKAAKSWMGAAEEMFEPMNPLQEVAVKQKYFPTAAAVEIGSEVLGWAGSVMGWFVTRAETNKKEAEAKAKAKNTKSANQAASASLLPAAVQAAAPRSVRSSDGGAFFCGGRPPLSYDASRSSRSSDGAFFAPRPSGGVPSACRPPLRVSRCSGGFIPSPSARASGGAAAMMVPGGAAQLPAAVCRAACSLKPRSSAGASFIPAARFAMMHL